MKTRRIAVVGGGIAGLSTAFHIRRIAVEHGVEVDVHILERDKAPGGKIQSVQENGFLCEAGPSGFLDNEPATLRLVKHLDMKESLLRSSDAARLRYVMHKGTFHQLQMNPVLFMKSKLLSVRGRARVVGEMFTKPKSDEREETVGQFGRRRLGKEFTEVMLDSMVSGIFAGDVDRLSIEAAFPKVPEMERTYGGLIKAMQKKRAEIKQRKKSGDAGKPAQKVEAGPGGVLHSFLGGMGEMIETLATRLGPGIVHTGANVTAVSPYGESRGYRLQVGGETLDVDCVVFASPAHTTSHLLRPMSESAANSLRKIPFAGVHVVGTGYDRGQVEHSLNGFGALIPRKEKVRVLGSLWNSSTFDGRAPEGSVMLSTMVGGAHDLAANDLSDDELLDLIRTEVAPMYGIKGDPKFLRIFRWPVGIPQYELGHLDRVAQARQALKPLPGLFLTGNSVAGVSFNHCIRHAEEVAQEVLGYLYGGSAKPPAEEAHA